MLFSVTPLYPQKLALTSPTGGGRSVGIVRSRTKATKFFMLFFPVSNYCLPLRPTHHSQHCIVETPQPFFSLNMKTQAFLTFKYMGELLHWWTGSGDINKDMLLELCHTTLCCSGTCTNLEFVTDNKNKLFTIFAIINKWAHLNT